MLSFLWGSARDTVDGGIAAATFLKSRDLHMSVSRSSVKQTLQSDAQQQTTTTTTTTTADGQNPA